MATKRTTPKPHQETICAVAQAAVTLALRGLPAATYRHLFQLDVGDFDRAAAAFVQHLLETEPAA